MLFERTIVPSQAEVVLPDYNVFCGGASLLVLYPYHKSLVLIILDLTVLSSELISWVCSQKLRLGQIKSFTRD
jgi:hypothetical protein